MGRSISYLFIGVFILIVFACENSSETEEKSAGTEVGEGLEDFSTRLDLALAQKKDWYEHWVSKTGRFTGVDFELMFADSLDGFEMPEKNPILENDPLFPYQIKHPGGNGTVDIYSYKVEEQDENGNPYLNPDSEVAWYKADGMKERLLFMGPSGMFEEGMWLNEEEFLVLGYFMEEEGYRPMAWLINVNKQILEQFRMKRVAKDYEKESYLNQKIKKLELS